jgi:hypothetical protein
VELRKTWTTYSSSIKQTASLIRRKARNTGGGPPEQLTALQDKVVGILGNTPIEGIGGGTDTLLHIVSHILLLVALVVVLDNLLNKTDRFLSTPSTSISSSAY